MAEAASLHLRPIFTPDSHIRGIGDPILPKIRAVTDSQLLIQLNWIEYRIGQIGESENDDSLVVSRLLDLDKTFRARWSVEVISFADSRTLCVIESPRFGEPYLRVIRAADDFFQVIVESKNYPLDISGVIKSLQVHDGHGFMATQRVNAPDAGFLHEFWEFQVPDPTSSGDSLKLLRCGEYPGSSMLTSETNGRFYAGRVNHQTRFPNVIGNVETGHYRTITGSEHDVMQVFENTALRWTISWDKLALSIYQLGKEGSPYTHSDYDVNLPLSESELRKEDWRERTTIHIAKAGCGRFFIKRIDRILMGYLPGADVPLEEVAAAAVWRNLPPSAQEDLLSKNHLSRRQILLRAMKEEEMKTLKKTNDA